MNPIQSILFRPLHYIRMKSRSLFLRLLAGFLCIILLLVALISYAISVSKNNVRHEIVKYNTLMLQNTMGNYEKHFEMIKKQMYLFYYTEGVQRLQRDPRYTSYPDIIKEIQSWVSNPYLFIDNIIFYSKDHDFVLEKDSSTKPDLMFNVFFSSERYPMVFWEKQFVEDYSDRIFPSDSFYKRIISKPKTELGEFIPMVFKQKNNQDFYMVVFLNAQKMYEAFYQTINEDFIIYNEAGETTFKRSASDSFLPLKALDQHKGNEFILNDNYHFITKGTGSGMTYMYRLPVSQMASQTQLNITMVIIIVVVILLSVLISFLLATRINNPLKRLVDSLRVTNEAEPYRSNIHEFDMIGSQLSDKKKILKQWAFINHLKDIRNHEIDSDALDFSDKTFVFVLFHVVNKKNAFWVQGSFQRWLYYIKAFIEMKWNKTFPDAFTFQIEYNQILSLVFVDQTEDLEDLLNDFKLVFDQDLQSGTITIAISSTYTNFNQVPEAYKEVHERIGDRRLIDETQIVNAPAPILDSFGFTQEQDTEFQANLKEGHAEALALLMKRFFEKWRNQEVTSAAWLRFATGLIARVRQVISSDLIPIATLDDILADAEERIHRCVTIEELEILLLDWVEQIAETINEKRERKDAITSFVMEYVTANLGDEIYLDTLAEKLNISSGYLSTYFKEKTGTNIVEFINEARIRQATVLLVESQLKIQEVAEAVGYRNITSFNRMFKKYTGLKPSEYRKSQDARLNVMM